MHHRRYRAPHVPDPLRSTDQIADDIAAAVEWEASSAGQEEADFWDALTEAAWADLPEWTGPDLTEPAEDPVAETVPAEPPLPPGY